METKLFVDLATFSSNLLKTFTKIFGKKKRGKNIFKTGVALK